jgi:hypothetical protein
LKRRLSILALLACLCAGLVFASQGTSAKPLPSPPRSFFGIGPQSAMSQEDLAYMKAGGVESIRLPLQWSGVQPTRKGGYNWEGFDQSVEIAALNGIEVLPVLAGTPKWLSGKEQTMPIDTAAQRSGWTAFLKAAVKRYGPGGEFWQEHAQRGPGPDYQPAIRRAVPIRTWQVWNEANFFYFAYPVSAQRYAKLLTSSSRTIKAAEPGAKVILSGLFGRPNAHGTRGMPAATFLEQLYKFPGIKSRFDGIALHPYAANSQVLEEIVEEFHDVTVKNHDRVPMFITEMGWGSQNDYRQVAFEQGPAGQARQLKAAYAYLIGNWRRLDLTRVYWFSWRDLRGTGCDFCDSVGFFPERGKLRPKPAWRAFVRLTHGSLRP